MTSAIRAAALVYAAASAFVAAFQVALAAGAPWGAYAMGGQMTGALPPALRVAALAQAFFIGGLAWVVLSRAGMVRSRSSRAASRLVWVAVALSAVSLVLNLLTPSARERALWAPVALCLLASSVVVAVKTRRAVRGFVALGILLGCAATAVEFLWLRPSLPLISTAEAAEQARQRERLAQEENRTEQDRRAVMEIADRLREELAAQEARRKLQSN